MDMAALEDKNESCDDCVYEYRNGLIFPCNDCRRNKKDRYVLNTNHTNILSMTKVKLITTIADLVEDEELSSLSYEEKCDWIHEWLDKKV